MKYGFGIPGDMSGIIRNVLFLAISALSLTTCEKPERIIKIKTLNIIDSEISYTEATVKAEISDLGSLPIEDYGFVVSKNQTPRVGNSTVKYYDSSPAKGIFQWTFTGLDKAQKYYFRAFVIIEDQEIYSDEIKSFTTKESTIPLLTTTSVTAIVLTEVISGGAITNDGGETITKKGLCWANEAGVDLTNADDTTISLAAGTSWTTTVKGLEQGHTYYIRAYAVNAKGTGYGSELTFTTLEPSNATTLAASSITTTAATLNGTVNANNSSSTVTFEYGETTSYGTSVNATPGTVTGSSATSVSANISGLTQGTTYHFRVKSVSAGGTVNGEDITFTTLEPPVATTNAVSAVSNTTATLSGSVNAKNSSTTVTFEYGLTAVYGQTVNATPGTVTGSSAIAVTANITGLAEGTEYHYRVKATSLGGQDEGDDQTFTTLQPPTAGTGTATGVTSSGAILAGTVNANNSSTAVTFEYGTTTGYGTTMNATPNTVTGSSQTAVSVSVSGLNPTTTYHFRVLANSAGGSVTGEDQFFITEVPPPTVTDYDGNIYNTVQIGTQIWMKENLKQTHYSNGDLIPEVSDASGWSSQVSGALCFYNNDPASYKDSYGAEYNWYTTIDIRNVCPTGWHVPSDNEWTTLTSFLGGESVAGGKLKEMGTTHWASPNTGATNETGFTALPAGDRNSYGGYSLDLSTYSFWWSTTFESDDPWARYMNYNNSVALRCTSPKRSGFSIRCIKGEKPTSETNSATAVSSSTVALNGKVNPNGASTTVTFEYGTTTSYGSSVISSQSPVSSSIPVSVSAAVIGLTPGTTYHYRVKAENSGGNSLGADMVFTTDGFIDIDGNIYNSVKIGTQNWMKENLKVTHLNDGSLIPQVQDLPTWNGLTSMAYCNYNNDPAIADIYGRLYNAWVVETGKICPAGSHVPSEAEWDALVTFLGGETVAGGKLKEAGLTHWLDPNTGANNESGFTALPGGQNADLQHFGLGTIAQFWSSQVGGSLAYVRYTANITAGFHSVSHPKYIGHSIRCLKD